MDEILTLEQWYELESRIRRLYPELKDINLQYRESIEKDILKMVEYSLRNTKEILQGIIGNRTSLFPLNYYLRYNRNRRIQLKQH